MNDKQKLCIPFRVWESANLASAKDDARYYLNGVHIIGNRVESTNGHVAYIARIKDVETPEFLIGVTSSKKGVIISPKNKIPKWSKKNQIAHVVITINEKDADIEYVSFYGDRVSTDVALVVDGRFPNIPKLISGIRKEPVNNKVKIGIKTNYLDLPHKMLSHCKWPIVSLELFNPNVAMVFSLHRECLREAKETLIIMPARL